MTWQYCPLTALKNGAILPISTVQLERHTMNYEMIKAAAKELGVTVKELLALAPQNDPFYAGTPADKKQARWFADLWHQAGYISGVHLRRAHYWAVSQSPAFLMPDGNPYENTDKCWKFLTQASKMARYLGLIRIADVVDRKNPTPVTNATYAYGQDTEVEIEKPELKDPYIFVRNLLVADAQPYHLEIWCEKSTMNDVLEPLCHRYNANLVTFEGEVSISSVYDLIQRVRVADGKPARIFYISDFDPAGNSMPVAMSRKIEYMLQKYEYTAWNIKVRSIVLTPEQVATYQLPRSPIKSSEKRAGKFEAHFGNGATELDALEALYPGELQKIVRDYLAAYYSAAATIIVRTRIERLRTVVQKKIDEVTARYAEQIEAMEDYLTDLSDIKVDATDYKVDQFEATVPEVEEDWLFDSSRSYGDQIIAYKQHKNGSWLL